MWTTGMDIRELLADMKASKLPPTSACPSPEEYARYMRQYDECLVITLPASSAALQCRP